MFVERDCTVEHEGKVYEANGAVVTDQYAIGYVASGIRYQDREHFTYTRREFWGTPHIVTWHGESLGYGRIVSSWRTYYGWLHQIEVTINSVKYTGRTQGNGMIWKGKRVVGQ